MHKEGLGCGEEEEEMLCVFLHQGGPRLEAVPEGSKHS